MTDQYILDEEGNPIREPDLNKWAKWYQKVKRHVADEKVGNSRISTVFLAIDHAWDGGSPLLWETMVFGGLLDGEQERCSGLYDDAKSMHNRMVERVNKSLCGVDK